MLNESRTVVITGVNRGIGRALASRLIAQGDQVIGIGRVEYAQVGVQGLCERHYIRADLTNEASIVASSKRLKALVPAVDLLVHNAAIASYGELTEQSNSDEIIKTNTIAPILLTRELSDALFASARCRVVFISSVHSRLPTKLFATYTSSKRAIEGFARSLREEWKAEVEIQVLYVGATATKLHKVSGVPAKTIAKWRRVSPDLLAIRICAAFNKPPRWKTLYFQDWALRTISVLFRPLIDRQTVNHRRKNVQTQV